MLTPYSNDKKLTQRIFYGSQLYIFAVVLGTILMYSLSTSAQEKQDLTHSAITSEDKRFIDNGDRTITDSKTGLMWMKEDSYLSKGKWINWFESLEYIQQLNEQGFAGYQDWQMPTLEDLKTLYEPEKVNSKQIGREMKIHIDPIFAKEGCGASWSIKSNGRYNAYGLVYNSGVKFSHPKTSRSRKAVRAVRYASFKKN